MRKQTWLMILISIMCYLSTPSLGETTNQEEEEIPECLQKLMDCFGEHNDNDMKDPKFDRDGPEFDMKEYVCCPLLKQTVVPEKECLCSAGSGILFPFFIMLLDDTLGRPKKDEQTNGTRVLRFCGVIDDSVPSLAAFCKDSSPALTSPVEGSPSEVLAKKNTNNTPGRKYITFTALISVLILSIILSL